MLNPSTYRIYYSFAANFNSKQTQMNYRLLITTLLLSFSLASFAGNFINLSSAQKLAKNAYYERSYQSQPIDYSQISISDVRIAMAGNDAAAYIFNLKNGGFVIISADDALPPILGYSLDGYCPAEGINLNFDSYLQGYVDQVEYIRENNIEAGDEIAELWKKYSTTDIEKLSIKSGSRGVDALLSNLWNQDSPYNMLCPEDPLGPGGHVYAGCVATAMSMVMHYWRYPLQGTGSSGYYPEGYPYQFANYGETEYIFNNMQDEMDADMPDVALLQYHCGVSVEMMYSAGGSGAYSNNVPGAIKSHFGYSNAAQYRHKEDYTQTQWINLLKAQIDLGQPMYYSGSSNSGGHAFVCDGYDDEDLFHFNFGWSGSSNGYYALNSVGGFSQWQGAVINFFPGGDYPYNYTGQQVLTGKSGSIEDGSGPVENYLADNQVSWLISPQSPEDSISSITLSFVRFDIATDDMVTVYDGATESSNILGTFTGIEIPEQLESTGNQILIKLQSNGTTTANGFLAEYTCETPTWCDAMTMLSEPAGEISDGSQDFKYDNNTNCKWMINPENASTSTLYFTAFDTEENNDKLLIYDMDGMATLAEISGSYTQGNLPEPVTSPSGKFFIVFVTNDGITGQGFDAYYAPEIVGIDDATAYSANELVVFPNPAKDQFTMQLPSEMEGKTQVSIFSISGAKVFDNEIASASAQKHINISVDGYLPGLYVIIVRNGDQYYRKEVAVY